MDSDESAGPPTPLLPLRAPSPVILGVFAMFGSSIALQFIGDPRWSPAVLAAIAIVAGSVVGSLAALRVPAPATLLGLAAVALVAHTTRSLDAVVASTSAPAILSLAGTSRTRTLRDAYDSSTRALAISAGWLLALLPGYCLLWDRPLLALVSAAVAVVAGGLAFAQDRRVANWVAAARAGRLRGWSAPCRISHPAPTLLLVQLRWPPDSIVLVRADESTTHEATYREAAPHEVRIAQRFRVPCASGAWSATWRCVLIGASRGLVALAFEAAVFYALAMAAQGANHYAR